MKLIIYTFETTLGLIKPELKKILKNFFVICKLNIELD